MLDLWEPEVLTECKALEALPPMREAMLRLDPSLSTFTSSHLRYVRICMENRAYQQAALLLDEDIYTFPAANNAGVDPSWLCSKDRDSGSYITKSSGHSDKLTPGDVHEYYLLGATAYIGLKQYERAELFLEHVIMAPTAGVVNGLMLEAYRKWLLVSLLVSGTVGHGLTSLCGLAD